MRRKSFLLGFIFIVTSTILLLIFGDHRQNIQNIMSETHRQLKDNIQNIKDHLDGKADERKLAADEKYLDLLGFNANDAQYYPNNIWKNCSLPVIVSYAKDDNILDAVGLAKNIAHTLPNHTTLIYNLGLTKYNFNLIQSQCNITKCIIIDFNLDQFPSHVTDNRIHAWRPLLIQDSLRRAGGVLYLDTNHRLRGSPIKLLYLFNKTYGNRQVLTFLSNTGRPVTSLTHPHMFKYFQADIDHFIFLPMVGPSPLLVYNTKQIHQGVMLPWVQCALTHECIFPIGAQSSGCRFDKKPGYRYSGCHGYDVSALNIVLGLHFKFRPELYSSSFENQLFTEIGDELELESTSTINASHSSTLTSV